MSDLHLHLYPDPVLREICLPVLDFEADLATLAEHMLEIMYQAHGRGLAGPQVGVSRRIFVMDASWKEGVKAPVICINPEVLWMSDQMEYGEEGCLSIPDTPCRVQRPVEIDLRWVGSDGALSEARLTGVVARIVLHELDHLDGILCIDRHEAVS
ncbi:peptide deformylase [Gymnodinialimonas sp. 2305UL16-5]|uniref:peptide deformylase n=1 Tax=Gymnodinialimonas mytili TaxID=3126503 RepID=UPI0030ACC7EE